MSDCEYEIDGDDFIIQNQEVVGDDNEDEDEEEEEFSVPPEQILGDDESDSSEEVQLLQQPVIPMVDDEEDEESDEEIPSPPIEPPEVEVIVQPLDELDQDEEDEEEEEFEEIHQMEVEEDEEGSINPSSNVSVEAEDIAPSHDANQASVVDEEEEEDDEEEQGEQEAQQTSNPNEDEEVVITPDKLNEHGIYKWKEFIGASIRQYTPDQYKAMQIPFHQGWKRELVIRGSSTTEKKAGDVYYYPPDGTAKLRSYVELSGYLKKNPECGLVKENFTYAKQPVWRPPDEIVRAALARGCNYVQRPMYFQQATQSVYKNPYRHLRGGGRGGHTPSGSERGSPNKKTTNTTDFVEYSNEGGSGGEQLSPGGSGRGKRKRVIPSRYDDDNFALLPTVKKSKSSSVGGGGGFLRESLSNGNSQDSVSNPSSVSRNSSLMASTSKMDRRTNLQKQLLQQVHEDSLKKKALEEQKQQMQANGEGKLNGGSLKIKIPKSAPKGSKNSANGHYSYMEELLDTSHGQSLLKNTTADSLNEPNNDSGIDQNVRQPCSAYCAGRRNMLPNLMCSRCFCLFHLECVPDGLFLKEPTCFICSNCLTPEDKEKSVQQSNKSISSETEALGNNGDFNGEMDTFDSPVQLNYNPIETKHIPHSMKNTSSSLLKNSNSNGYPSFMNGSSLMAGKGKGAAYGRFGKGVANSTPMSGNGGGKTLEMMLNGFGSAKPASHFGKSSGNHKFLPPSMGKGNAFQMYGKQGRPYGQYTSLKSGHPQSQQMNFQPSINHVYRLANASNGHQVVLKNKTMPYGNNGSVSYMSGPTTSSKQQMYQNSKTAQNYARSVQPKQQQLHGHSVTTHTNTHILEDQLKLGSIKTESDGKRRHESTPNRYSIYFQKHNSLLNSFTNSLSGLVKILDYLDTKDIISLRQVSRFWYQVTKITPIWAKFHFRGLPIVDWSHLSSKVIGSNMVTTLNFEGVRIPAVKDVANDNSTTSTPSITDTTANKTVSRQEKICAFWRQFSILYNHLSSVKVLKFGTIPLFVLQELIRFAADQPINPFASLKTLSVLNLFDDTMASTNPDAPVCLADFFSSLVTFQSVNTFRLESKNGFVLQRLVMSEGDTPKSREDHLQSIVNTIAAFTNLHKFSFSFIRDLSSDEFAQILAKLNHNNLTHLELGSCANWFDEAPHDPFEEIAKCSKLTNLKFIDINIGSGSGSLVTLFESLIQVERLTIENLKTADNGYTCWNSLNAMFRSLPLHSLHLTTNDPFTNRAVFEAARELVSSQKRVVDLTWVASVNIDDHGHCFIPLSLTTFTASPHAGLDFVKKYLASLDSSHSQVSQEDTYHIMEGENGEPELVLVELSTLADLLNRDVNLNALPPNEPKVSVRIIPQ